jgi:hypothetical protein
VYEMPSIRPSDDKRVIGINPWAVTSALPAILQSAPGAKCDLRDLRERRVRIRCKMPKSSEDRLRIIIDKGSAFGVLTESVTGSCSGLGCCLME